jgi:hypothetical protein
MSGPHTEQYERPELEQRAPFGTESEEALASSSGYWAHYWTSPLSSRPLTEHPVAAFLSELADAIADGGPEPYSLTWRPGRVAMQLEPGDQDSRAALHWWAARLGATSVRVIHDWSAGYDRYSIEEAFAGSRLESWTVVPRPGGRGESTSFIPVEQLDRGFDQPPPARDQEEPDTEHDERACAENNGDCSCVDLPTTAPAAATGGAGVD